MSQSKREGFTLVEMAIILVIVGLIAGMILPAIIKSIQREQITNARRKVRMARDEIIGYVQVHKKLPKNLTEIGHGKDYFCPDDNCFNHGYLFYRYTTNIWEGNNTSKSICDVNSTELKFKTSTGDTIPYIVFIIASKGPNFNFQLYNDTNEVQTFRYGEKIDKFDQDLNGPREEPYDDIVEFVTLDYLQNIACNKVGNDAPPPGSDVSFALNWQEFMKSGGVELQNKDTVSLSTNSNEKYISLGNGKYSASGCYWYPGNSTDNATDGVAGTCTNGICQFGKGIRVFFRFKMLQDNSQDSKAQADGFTFALISATKNNNIATTCGGSGGGLGYAGSGIEIPKIATEIDVYPNNYYNDPNNNHFAFLYWGTNDLYNDDVKHSVPLSPPPPSNCDCGVNNVGIVTNHPGCFYQNSTFGSSAPTWLEDGEYHTFRLDIKRDDSSGELHQQAWIDCAEDRCRDLRDWFDGSSGFKIEDNSIPKYYGDKLDQIYFGWTVGVGGKTQNVIIKDFGINFL